MAEQAHQVSAGDPIGGREGREARPGTLVVDMGAVAGRVIGGPAMVQLRSACPLSLTAPAVAGEAS
eukprot:6742855-Alexandrium_andersonii.AAC.1